MKYTTFLNLKKPEKTDVVNIDHLNENSDILDDFLEQTDAHIGNKSNPHSVTKSQVGLGNVDNVKQAPLNHTHGAGDITETTNKRFMTDAERAKLDGIQAGANNYSLPIASSSVLGGVKVGSRLSISSDGTLSANLQTDNNFTTALKNKLDGIEAGAQVNPGVATTSANGLMSSADKVKLNGIEAGAQKNSSITKAEIEAKLTGTISSHSHSYPVSSVAGKTGAVTLTKSDVGLGSVQNYGIATQAQAEAGTSNSVYMTPLRVAEAISSLTPVKSVAGKTGAVTLTKSDVGLGSVQNYGIATQAQAQAGTANNVYMTPLRVKEAIEALGIETIMGSGIDGAGFHNSIYRGKNLGTSVTSEQYARIADGTFEDMYIGDYWTINGVTYLIAAFNYYYNTGETSQAITTNHITLVPAGFLYNRRMNSTVATEGGYANSEMRTSGLDQAKTRIHADFPGRVLTHRRLLSNATSNGAASGAAWFDSDVELMNEIMVYGSVVNGKGGSYNIGTEKSQLPLFALRPDLLNVRTAWWLRDVCSAIHFACVSATGSASVEDAPLARGIRPVFSISA